VVRGFLRVHIPHICHCWGGADKCGRAAAEVAELRALYGPRKEWTELDAETILIKRTANYGRGLHHPSFQKN
jgi:hypothetical protein